MSNQDPKVIQIAAEPIELCKLLKLGQLVESGGQATMAIAEGLVSVNGAVETRKRKKIVSGDIVEFAQKKLRVVLS